MECSQLADDVMSHETRSLSSFLQVADDDDDRFDLEAIDWFHENRLHGLIGKMELVARLSGDNS